MATEKTLDEILARRNDVQSRIAKSLEHLPKDEALHLIMSWIDIDHLESASRTICKG